MPSSLCTREPFLSFFQTKVYKFNVFVILDCDFGHFFKHKILEDNGASALYDYLFTFAAIEVGEGDSIRIFNHDLRVEDLTSTKDKAVSCAKDLNAHALVFIRVVEGAAYDRAVRIIIRLTVAVIDKESRLV